MLGHCTIALTTCATSIARADESATVAFRHAFGALLESVLKVHAVATNDPRYAPAMTLPTLSSAMHNVHPIIESCAAAAEHRVAFLTLLGQVGRHRRARAVSARV